MKSTDVTKNLRTLATSFVLVSFVGQQLAFATPANDAMAPLALAKNGKQAVAVIQMAESRPFASYFAQGGTPVEIARLDADMRALAEANKLAGIADDLEKFQPWWDLHQTSILLQQAKLKNDNFESFFTQVFIMFKAEETRAEKDPSAFLGWLSSKVTSPIVRTASFTAFAIVIGTFSYTLGLVKGAMVAGPAASMIGALVEPIVRPIREKAGIIGSRFLGAMGVRLSAKLFNEGGTKEAAAGDLQHLSEEVKAAREGAKQARELMNSMGYDLSPSEYAHIMGSLHTFWNKTNQVWVQTNPSLFKDGRDVFTNAIALRPLNYAGPLMQSVAGAEQARQGIETAIDRLISRTGREPKAVEETVVELLRAVEIDHRATGADTEKARENLAKAKETLKELGATDYQVGRIIDLRISELVNVRQTAYTLALNVIHEMQYPEYNRALPEDVQSVQRSLRAGTCLDYFHHEYATQVAKIVSDMDLGLRAAQEAIEAAAAAPNSPLKVVPAREEHLPPPRQATTVSSFLKDKAARATAALGRLNRVRTNEVAIERTGELRGEKTTEAGHGAAEEIAKVVGKK